MSRRLSRLVLLLLILTQLAATCRGTETGNPGVPSGIPGGGAECPVALKSQAAFGSDEAVDDLIAVLCSKIILCGLPTTTDTCFNALNGPEGDPMTDEFGLPEGAYTVEGLREALIQGELLANDIEVPSCEAAIGSVDCGEVEASVLPEDFSGTEDFVPEACLSVFSFAEADAAPVANCP